jgi:hypothetical protein
MDSPERAAAIRAVTAVLGGIVPLCVEHAITSPELESLLRSVYVHGLAASTEKDKERPTALSISLRSGVHRNYVSEILKSPPQIAPRNRNTRRHRINRMLDGWHVDPDFMEEDGAPSRLSLDASLARKTFAALVDAYAPGVRESRMLKELERVNAVEISGGFVLPLLRQYKAATFSEEGLQDMARKVGDLVDTMMKNEAQAEWPNVCDTVDTIDIDPRRLVTARNVVKKWSESFAAGLKSELHSKAISRKPGSKGPRMRYGVTFFSHLSPVAEGADVEE